MTPPAANVGPATGFVDWLTALPDDALVRLCLLRPDTSTPAPASIEVLASRLRSPASTARALDGLSVPELLVLATVVDLGAERRSVTPAELARRLGVKVSDPDLVAAVAVLRDRALVWGPSRTMRVTPATAAAARSSPVVVPEPGETAGPALEKAWSTLSDRARSMAEAIGAGRVPTGTLGERPSESVLSAAAELESAGLARVDRGTVTPTAHALDRARTGARPRGSSLLQAPVWPGSPGEQSETDATAGVAALDLLHRCEALLTALSTSPAATLKSGGVGVRELRRLARLTGLDETELPLLLEVSAAAGLLACGDVEVGEIGHDDVWAPTDSYEIWAARNPDRRWAELLLAWWTMPWRPWRVGSEVEGGGTLPALVDPAGPPGARTERHRVLAAVSVLDPLRAVDPTAAIEVLRRRWPWWIARHGTAPGLATLAEARRLGLVVGLSATGAARLLVATEDPRRDGGHPDAEDRTLLDRLTVVLESALPAPVSEVIVQADLTILAPGPLVPELGAEIALLAEVESVGAATTYRVTEGSLRRALDSGRTAAGIRDLLERTSITPVPQSLDYLIEDVSRRHGRLRVGAAQSFVRCDDEALVAQVLASPAAERCAVRRVAPTVLVSQARPMELLDALQEVGLAPVIEDTTGSVVSLNRTVARVPSAPPVTPRRVPVRAATEADLRVAVAAMRTAEQARAASSGGGTRRTGEAAVAYLHDSADTGRTVAVQVVDPDGRATTRLIVPATVAGGRVEGIDPATSRPLVLPLHRVIAVTDTDGDPD